MDTFAAQQAAKLSAEELQQLTRELFNWSKDAKQKAGRKGLAAEAAPANAAAPAAGQPAAAAQPQQQQAAGAQPQQQQAAAGAARHPADHTYEHYRSKWDKFDVDGALAEDGEPRAAAVNGSSAASSGAAQRSGTAGGRRGGASRSVAIPEARVTVPVGPSPPLLAAGGSAAAAAPTSAAGWKDAGNEHFKQGRYRQAVECYTASLEREPSCLAAANRAMARLKLGQHAAAEADCGEALRLEPGYVKAHLRRATARRQLGNLLGAVEDCEAALRLEPNNRQAAADRAAHVRQLLQQHGLRPASREERLVVRVAPAQAEAAAGGGPAPVGGAAEELLPVSSVQRRPPAAVAEGSPPASLRESQAGEARGAGTPRKGAPLAPTAAIQVLDSEGAESALPELLEPGLQQQQPAAAAAVTLDQRLTILEQQQQAQFVSSAQVVAEPIAAAQLPGEGAAVPPERGSPAAAAAPLPAALDRPSATVAAPPPFRKPRTGVEFEKAWKGLKGDPLQQAAFLLALEPAQLPTLLRQALSPGLLAAAATALLGPALEQCPGAAVELLDGLTGVARFDINLLSVPPRHKADLTAVWDAAAARLAAADSPLAGSLGAVRQKYKL